MELIINNNIITEPIENIIYQLKREANWNVFKEIQNKGAYLRLTCPFHAEGEEKHPSCSVFIDYNSDTIIPGTYHCFTCHTKGQLYQLVAYVLNISEEQGKTWLTERYGNIYYKNDLIFPNWNISVNKNSINYLDESILDQYRYYHPYAEQRHISFDIAKKFLVGFNQLKNTLTFPVWDERNNLLMITERSILDKKFYIQEGIEKPVYLLNFVLKEHLDNIIVVEGQIDALVAWSYGMPAVALFGSGTTDYQMNILNKAGIHHFILMYDNDEAGRKGAKKFIRKINKDIFITDILMPKNKDVADCTKDEFYNILKNNNILV